MNFLQTKEFWYFFIPLVATIVFYYLNKSLKDEKKHLILIFKGNQTISLRIQDKLKGFISEFNAENAIAFPERNVTYGTFLEMTQKEYQSNLSDKRLENMQTTKLPKPTLLAMIDSLNKQNEALRLMEMDMDVVIQKAREGRI